MVEANIANVQSKKNHQIQLKFYVFHLVWKRMMKINADLIPALTIQS